MAHAASAMVAQKLADYELLEQIGEGKYAAVFKARRTTDNTLWALKKIRLVEMSSEDRARVMHEADILRRLAHPNIIRCDDAFSDDEHAYSVLELAEGGDMQRLIEQMRAKKRRFSELDIWRFVYGIGLGLRHMHDCRIMHRDIKPENVYVTSSGDVKLGDLGLGRVFSTLTVHAASMVGTPYYMSPELVQGQLYSVESDIWAFGCVVYQLAMLRVPFQMPGNNLYELGRAIVAVEHKPMNDRVFSPTLVALVESIMQRDPAARPTAHQICTLSQQHLAHLLGGSSVDVDTGVDNNGGPAVGSDDRKVLPSSMLFQGGSVDNHGVMDDDTMVGDDAPPPVQRSLSSLQSSSSSSSSSMSSSSFADPSTDNWQPLDRYHDLGVIGRGKYSEVHRASVRACLCGGGGSSGSGNGTAAVTGGAGGDQEQCCGNMSVAAHALPVGTCVAVKKVMVLDMDSTTRNECVNESRLLQSLPTHPHIIQYIDSFMQDETLHLVLELAECGDLSTLLAQARAENRYLDEQQVCLFVAQTAAALAFMHRHRTLHRDVKPANVFLTHNNATVKLGDLGLGRSMGSDTYECCSMVGTPYYMAPEVIMNDGYSFASDVWSLGCVAYELCALASPFYSKGVNYYTLGLRIKSGRYTPLPQVFSPPLHDMIASILVVDPTQRPSAEQVMRLAEQLYERARQQQTQQQQSQQQQLGH